MSEVKLKCTLTDNELVDKSKELVSKLCETGGHSWCLRVPVDLNNDPDIIFTELGNRVLSLRAQLAEAQKEAFPAYKREKALRCKAEAENAELKTEIERRNSKTWCAYCGFEIDIDDEASTKISEHIMSCPKHPIRIYERHSEALEAENASLRERLKDLKLKTCETCEHNDYKRLYCSPCQTCKGSDKWQAIKAACEGNDGLF